MDMAKSMFATVRRRQIPPAGNADPAFFAGPAAGFKEILSYRDEARIDMSKANPLESIEGASVALALHGTIRHFWA
jgi:hypothetical protein